MVLKFNPSLEVKMEAWQCFSLGKRGWRKEGGKGMERDKGLFVEADKINSTSEY